MFFYIIRRIDFPLYAGRVEKKERTLKELVSEIESRSKSKKRPPVFLPKLHELTPEMFSWDAKIPPSSIHKYNVISIIISALNIASFNVLMLSLRSCALCPLPALHCNERLCLTKYHYLLLTYRYRFLYLYIYTLLYSILLYSIIFYYILFCSQPCHLPVEILLVKADKRARKFGKWVEVI